MTPTRTWMLLAVAAISTVLGWALADIVDTLWQRSFPVPWSSVITVGACAGALFGWALSFRRKIRPGQAPIDPFVAVRTAALAMAASRAGAVTTGLYAGIGLWFVGDLSREIAQQRALTCAVGVVVSVALVAVALWLERICRIPRADDDADGSPPPDDPSADWVLPRTTAR